MNSGDNLGDFKLFNNDIGVGMPIFHKQWIAYYTQIFALKQKQATKQSYREMS